MDQSFKFTHQLTSPFSPLTSFCILILIFLARSVLANSDPFHLACSVSKTCGDGQIISYPFYIEGQQEPYCGYPGFQLSCNNKGNPVLKLANDSSYVIQEISYKDQSVRVTNAAVFEQNKDACHFPRIRNVSLPEDSFLLAPNQKEVVLLYNCSSSLPEEFLQYKADNFCRENQTSTVLALLGDSPNLDSASKLCREVVAVPVDRHGDLGIEEMVRRGFLLEWIASNCSSCEESGGKCGFNESTYHFNCYCPDRVHAKFCPASRSAKGTITKIVVATLASGLVILIVLSFWISKKFSLSNSIFWKKKTGNYQNIEAFLRNYGSIAPKRYTYSDIKIMTNSFKHKLGQGGYGGVYKGKFSDGRSVAVKVLNETKGNGEEFINEVASISRTSHVNIVTLLGFCFEGHRRALIYEFVSNGSLEKFIYQEHPLEIDHKLKWGMLFKIAIGIARGLEYLHCGCNTRILHFDIKPHNILIDEDFCPKISDFGLAKICPQKQSIVSMTGARGTVGYIAPEVFCRNFGQVSYKSDVYSYGMMVFEMTGGRKNMNAGIDHSSEVYFPHWVYKRLELEEDFGLQGIENEEDKVCAKKMLIVSLWCIQNNPSDRPAMNRVVEMLEGSFESLQMPPKPFLSSPGSLSGSSTTLILQTESSLAT